MVGIRFPDDRSALSTAAASGWSFCYNWSYIVPEDEDFGAYWNHYIDINHDGLPQLSDVDLDLDGDLICNGIDEMTPDHDEFEEAAIACMAVSEDGYAQSDWSAFGKQF